MAQERYVCGLLLLYQKVFHRLQVEGIRLLKERPVD
jgi:hypothetical protein